MTTQHTTSASVERGQRWRHKHENNSTLRVLAFAERYAMVRYPYCQVWVIHENDLRKTYELLSDDERLTTGE